MYVNMKRGGRGSMEHDCFHHGNHKGGCSDGDVGGGPDQGGTEDKAKWGVTRRMFLRGSAVSAAGLLLASAIPRASAQSPGAAQTFQFDQVPDLAKGPAIPSKGYLVERLGDGLYHVTEGSYQVMFLTTGKGVIVVDAPPTIGGSILRAIHDITNEPITHVIYSHAHADHIGAAVLYPHTAVRIAHEDTARLLRAVPDPNRPVPTVTFKNRYQLSVGNQILQLEYKGPNHTPGNIFIYAPRQKVLMFVDVIFPGWVPFEYLAISQDIPGWIKAHDQVLAYPFERIIAGHLTRLGTRQDAITQHGYIRDLEAASREAIATVKFEEIMPRVKDPSNPWALFVAYLDITAQRATDATLAKWRGRLGGADVFTFRNASTMIESLRVDYGVLGPFGIRK